MGLPKAESGLRRRLDEAILAACKEALGELKQVSVEGLLGVTLNNDQIFLLSVHHQVAKPSRGRPRKRHLPQNSVKEKTVPCTRATRRRVSIDENQSDDKTDDDDYDCENDDSANDDWENSDNDMTDSGKPEKTNSRLSKSLIAKFAKDNVKKSTEKTCKTVFIEGVGEDSNKSDEDFVVVKQETPELPEDMEDSQTEPEDNLEHIESERIDKSSSQPLPIMFPLLDNEFDQIASVVTAQEIYQCTACSKGFRSKKGYLDHLASAHSLRPSRYKCEFCDKSFQTRTRYSSHVMYSHKQIKMFECAVEGCGKSYCHKKDLKGHETVVHGKGQMDQCSICGALVRPFGLPRHMRTHSRATNQYMCHECGHSFTSKQNMSRHILTKHKDVDMNVNSSASKPRGKAKGAKKTRPKKGAKTKKSSDTESDSAKVDSSEHTVVTTATISKTPEQFDVPNSDNIPFFESVYIPESETGVLTEL